MGGCLAGIGLDLARETSVRDSSSAISSGIQDALRRADVLVISGGLGPTSDDLTRDVLAEITGSAIVTNSDALENIRVRCERASREITASRARQALVLEAAEILPNSVGMAPGEWIEREGKILIALPGPPREFHAVLTEQVLPRLKKRYPDAAICESAFQLCGIAESDFVDALQVAGFAPVRMEFACCASPAHLDIRLRGPLDATAEIASASELVRRVAGRHLVTDSTRSIESVVVEQLGLLGKTVAVAESCTGGLIGGRITSVSGSSNVFIGGVIAYSNEVKSRHLGVRENTLARFGAVSEETVREMAAGIRKRFGSDIGLAVTGIAGPGGGTPGKPVGLVWIAADTEIRAASESFRMTGERDVLREAAVQMALDLLRRSL